MDKTKDKKLEAFLDDALNYIRMVVGNDKEYLAVCRRSLHMSERDLIEYSGFMQDEIEEIEEVKMKLFTKEELKALRKEICLCSIYIKDYENSFGIDPKVCCDFFDGYADYLGELIQDDDINARRYFEVVEKYDTADNLWNWYNMFEDDPLPLKPETESEDVPKVNGVYVGIFSVQDIVDGTLDNAVNKAMEETGYKYSTSKLTTSDNAGEPKMHVWVCTEDEFLNNLTGDDIDAFATMAYASLSNESRDELKAILNKFNK